jgi:hypothetical protein
MKRQNWLEAISPFSIGDFAVFTYSAPERVWCPHGGYYRRTFKTIKGKVSAIGRDGIAIAGRRLSYRMAVELGDHPAWG